MASVKEILVLLESIDDERYVLVYGDHGSFREIYAQHAKRQIEKNEVVILLPYYETAEKVHTMLSRAEIDVRAHEGTGSLIIIDSYVTFLGFRQENELTFSRMVSHAIVSRKAGICIVADMGAFFLIDRTAEIAAGRIRVRGFCAYHCRDFDKLSEGQRKAIFGRAYKVYSYNKLHKSCPFCNCQA